MVVRRQGMADLTAPKVPVVWKTDTSEADRLLGKRFRPVLDGIIELMQQTAIERKWPLKQINIRYRQDMEFPEWEILRVCAVLKTDPATAEEHYRAFLRAEANAFQKSLDKAKRKKFIERIWFGFEAV